MTGILLRVLHIIWGIVDFTVASTIIYLNLAIVMSLVPVSERPGPDEIEIYVKTNGVHTDLCLPVYHDLMNWTDFIPQTDFPKVHNPVFVSIGWGDKGFFLDTPTWADLKFSTAFKAAFLPSPTAMHVQYLEAVPAVSESCRRENISQSDYKQLISYICDSFRLREGKVDLIPNKGYWSNDNFYEANGSYHLFNTCNAWTNRGLKIAGVRTAFLALFSDGIMRHLSE